MKNILLTIFSIVLIAAVGRAQSATAAIGHYEENPGAVSISVDVTGFTNVAAISIYFSYDATNLTYTGYSNIALTGMEANALTVQGQNVVGITWSASGGAGVDVTDGTLLTIQFNYIGGSSDFTFPEAICEVIDNTYTEVPVFYTNGSISPQAVAVVNIEDVEKDPNTLVEIPLNVDFSAFDPEGISSFDFTIDFDPDVITWQGFTNEVLNPIVVEEISSSRISISWLNPGASGSTLSGKLLDMVFNYSTGESDLTFVEALCNIGDNSGLDVNGSYTNGSIAQNPATAAQISLPDVVESINQTINVPLTVDFSGVPSGVSSFTYVVDFDNTVLQYSGFSGFALSGTFDVDIISASRVAFSWLNGGENGTFLDGKLLDIQFSFSGGYSDLTFVTELSQTGDNNGLDVLSEFTDGAVSQDPGTIVKIIAATIYDAVPGTTVDVPVTVENFTGIGAFDLRLLFDNTALNFLELVNINAAVSQANLLSNVINGNELGINWDDVINAATIADGEKLFDVRFDYVAGQSALTFQTAECEISDDESNTLYAEYTDGLVSESAPADIAVKAAEVLAQPGSVLVPVTANSFEDIGAFDFVITFDTDKLTFNGLQNQLAALSGGDMEFNQVGNQVLIGWNIDPEATEGLDVADDEKLFDLSFQYLGGESDVLFIEESCTVSDFELETLAVSFQSGSVKGGIQVELTLFLEGLYNSTTGEMKKAQDFNTATSQTEDMYEGTIADLITVELHEAGSYGTPVYTIQDVELQQDGMAAFDIPADYSGSYYITVKHRNHLETVSANPVSFANFEVSYNFSTAAGQAYGNNMRQLSEGKYGIYGGDVNGDGFVDGQDVTPTVLSLRNFSVGYLPEDINGDGEIDGLDLTPLIVNLRALVQISIPD